MQRRRGQSLTSWRRASTTRTYYDVSPDDQRFLMIRRGELEQEASVILVQNFFEELKEKVGG